MTQPIFFAHANGFPSATYGKLFTALQPDYQIRHLPQHAHDPRFPVNDNWSNLVDELLYHLEQIGEPVWAVGHSLGGVLHYHAALRRPALYRGLVMLDSPVLTRSDQLMIRMAKRFGFIDRITPAGRTQGRREAFADLQEAHGYFAGKPLFSRFDPECLQAYVEHGLQAAAEGVRLRFEATTEISIYRSVPHISPGLPQQLQIPLALVRGSQSRVVFERHGRMARCASRGEFFTLPGGHMFPLEHPADTAALIRTLFTRWQAPAP